ncbi:hypothetical protein QYM36_014051 [Artemia franciscana]|uniref:Uncharacterized protein n=1 Tax=Artemia franciscana TaxID=6661 RepID=A0AA88L0J6_ARTSF|nr:hypothetical protein QYM36_014051 [Artemia franciscana]
MIEPISKEEEVEKPHVLTRLVEQDSELGFKIDTGAKASILPFKDFNRLDPSRSRSIPHSENTLNQQADSYESTYPYMTEPMLPMQGTLETEVEPSGLTHAEENNYERGRTVTHSSHQVETLVRLNLDIYKSKH